ncbi:DUF262 domain-containing protein [Duganella vulcania]|uniref:DUF262 domain-containing protein n=1 Tax=Duganella vulcania TaxID=2692166 RepID=A0A845GD10_9BURK|nr:DUF262 domain-containing protein [Duganella vulcania]MYM92503.1 DUF262 domain-containing protein [Duganella vulcania]
MRIEQSSGFLLDFVRHVGDGRVLPAAMQRPYVWTKQDVEAMCDSIMSGFPIGSFLLWQPEQKFDLATIAKHRLGPIHAASDAEAQGRPHYLLLDGQNRLATIAWMMLRDDDPLPNDPSEAEAQTWLSGERLVLDGVSRSVKFVPADEAATGLRVPAWTLVSNSRIGHADANQLVRNRSNGPWLQQFPESEIEDFWRLWDSARDRFKDTRTSQTVIQDASPDEARHAFIRICKVGVPMSVDDFDSAIGWHHAA